MSLRRVRRSQSIEGQCRMDDDGSVCVGCPGLRAVLAVSRESGEEGQGAIRSAKRP